MNFAVNMLPVIIISVLLMPLGAFLYSEKGLGKAWMKAIGKTREEIDASSSNMGLLMGVAFLSSLITVYLIGVLIKSIGIVTIGNLLLVILVVYFIVFFIRLKGTVFDENFPLFKVNLAATFFEFVITFIVFAIFL